MQSEQADRSVQADSAAGGSEHEHEVVILGAGMSGLCMAVQLRRAGVTDFVVVEQSAGLGGTWWDNRYPGAQVDVPAPVYALSFAPNPNWRQRFADAPEIAAYMQDVARRFGVLPHLRLSTRITAARFDAGRGRWLIDTVGDTVRDGRPQRLAARFFVCSTGPLSQPRWPAIEGLDGFAGRRLHTARWPAGETLAGLRVGVVGTGSTAVQLVPAIAPQVASLAVFQRTANWILPRLDRRYTALDRALAQLPPYAAAVRAAWVGVLEWGRRGFDEGTIARRGMLASARLLLERQVADPALRARLQPPYPLGCKRICYSNTYYPALVRPHVELVTDRIVRAVPQGLETAGPDGRAQLHALDALVCATGFDTVHLLSSLDITGAGGRTLREAWRDTPEAWRGIAVAGFPNLFLLLGPNTGTGHTSTLLYIEPEVRHVLQAMAAVRRRGSRWIAIREDRQRAHNAALQARLEGSVWTHCRSWYRNDAGRVVALWPGFTREYVRSLARLDEGDWVFG